MKEPLVSVIIPVRRNEDISRLLYHLNESEYRNFETIIVDEGLERSAQRNIGILRAKGEYLLILDSDQYPSPHTIKECVGLVTMCNYGALYITERVITKGFFGKLRDWERQFYTATPIDVVRFVKRHGCPLFDEKMTGPEDSDWDRRVKGLRTYVMSPLLHNDNVSFLGYFKKKAYYSKSMKRYSAKHPFDKVLNWKWRCFKVFLENGKWRRFISKPVYAICVLGLILLRGVVYVWNK